MKKIMTSAAIFAVMTTGAFAQATQDVTITATVPAFCTIDGAATGTANTAVVPGASIVNGQAITAPVPLTNAASPSVCNKASTISLSSASAGNGIVSPSNAASVTSTFKNQIQYTASATIGATTATYASSGNVSTPATTAGATAANLVIAVATVATPPTTYLLPGTDYSDVLTVTLAPTP